jgi:hypothetical protein
LGSGSPSSGAEATHFAACSRHRVRRLRLGQQVSVLGIELGEDVVEFAVRDRLTKRPEDGANAVSRLFGRQLEVVCGPCDVT